MWHILPIIRVMAQNRTAFALVILEIAATFALSINSVSFLDYFNNLAPVLKEHSPAKVMLVQQAAWDPRLYGGDSNLCREDLTRLTQVTGITSASYIEFVPSQSKAHDYLLRRRSDGPSAMGTIGYADEHGLQALEANTLAGRNFTREEVDTGASVVLLSTYLAQVLFPGESPLGQEVITPTGRGFQVVGVFDDLLGGRLLGPSAARVAIFPERPQCDASRVSYAVLGSAKISDGVLIDTIRETLLANDARRVITVKSRASIIDGFSTSVAGGMSLLVIMVSFYTFIPVLGVVGLTVFMVQRRRRSIGIRRALGATQRDIFLHFLTEAVLITVASLLLGLILAYGLHFVAKPTLLGLRLTWEMVIPCIMVFSAIIIASALLPARQAARIAPDTATRSI